jgi:hypothetical protein
MSPVPQAPKGLVAAWGLLVAMVMAAYYYTFYFPPRLVGLSDPDRFYHLGLSRLIARQGLLRTLPQAEDLGWGHYFPDKEFLFHVITGLASWMSGPIGVLLITPLLGVAIVLCLYVMLARVMRPWQAALLSLVVTLATADFLFRLTLLRPQLLAILCFCLLLSSFLSRRLWLAFGAAMGFALAYHAFFVALIVIAASVPLRMRRDQDWGVVWPWALAGLVVGIVINPYFPSNLAMSWAHIQIALHLDVPPGAIRGNELQQLGAWEYLQKFGFLPFCVLGSVVVMGARRLRPVAANADIWFLFMIAGAFTALSMISPRAGEYAVAACILLTGYVQRELRWRGFIWVCMAALLLLQFDQAQRYYREVWSHPMAGGSVDYLQVIAAIPAAPRGAKVFNCEWWAGAYLLDQRPDLRFVDLLDPVFLWKASPSKYIIRIGLIEGLYDHPQVLLRQVFKADFVLCQSSPLIARMHADRVHFRPIASNEAASLWLFAVLPGD